MEHAASRDGYGVQFLSRPCLEPLLVVESNLELPDKHFQGKMSTFPGGLPSPPPEVSAQPPWPTGPTPGAVQGIDRYSKLRWPSHIAMQMTYADLSSRPRSLDEAVSHLHLMRHFLWEALQVVHDPPQISDQILRNEGYRLGGFTSYIDLYMHPLPISSESYVFADVGQPVGPGWVVLNGFDIRSKEHQYSSLACVWSQAFSLDGRITPVSDLDRIRDRVRNLRRHHNSQYELSCAEEQLERHDARAATRSSAAAAEACIRYYAEEWGIQYPSQRHLSFIDRIEQVLSSAHRPSYSQFFPKEAVTLLCLYRARSSMHEGDCSYIAPDTGARLEVYLNDARRFYEVARSFVLWMDSLA